LPKIQVVFYQEADGRAPVREWLADLRRRDSRAHARCVARIERLAELGHELRRPEADFLRDGLYELRARGGRVNYRILYFFHGRGVAILAHAVTKEDAVSEMDLRRALERKRLLEVDPGRHVHEDWT
jgi:putative component of toxin-antitoxin plasmid stabilization module